MCQAIRQVAVVGQQQQPCAIGVEAPTREHPHIVWHQLEYGWSIMRVLRRRDHARRLMQHEITVRSIPPGHLHDRSVDRDHIVVSVSPRSKLADDPAIHGDASPHDEILGRAQRCDTCACKDFM